MSSLTPERIAEIREEIQCSHKLTGILLMDERRLLDAFERIAELEAEVAALREDKARLLETLDLLRPTLSRWHEQIEIDPESGEPVVIDAARKGGAA